MIMSCLCAYLKHPCQAMVKGLCWVERAMLKGTAAAWAISAQAMVTQAQQAVG
jgi:hypothetical protein